MTTCRTAVRGRKTPRIDKSQLAHGEPHRERSPEHLAYIRTLPCHRCGLHGFSVPHHLLYAQPKARGLKAGDNFTIPLCQHLGLDGGCHTRLHAYGDEYAFWDAPIHPKPMSAEGVLAAAGDYWRDRQAEL